MIKLYAVAGACSLAPHIVLEELGLSYELKLFNWGDKPMRAELKTLNPMGQVPTLVTDEGYPLAEGAAIMQYLVWKGAAAKKPAANFFPKEGESHFKAFEWMNFISTALHKAFIPIFKPAVFSDDESHFEAIRHAARKRLTVLLEITEGKFTGPYALGENFTVVDAYLFAVLNWGGHFKVNLAPYKKLSAFLNQMRARPAVAAALKQEGLP